MTKRKTAEDKIYKTIDLIDPSNTNSKRYKSIFSKMSDGDFNNFMKDLKENKRKLFIYAPNMKLNLKVNDLLKAADSLGIKLFEKIKIWDNIGKRYFLTPKEYLILPLPVRRVKQFLMDKMSIPESDKKLDLYTGQVVQPDKGSSVSTTGMTTMTSKGLHKTVVELMTIRGGNPEAYAQMSASLVETGSAFVSDSDPDSRVRSVEVASAYLKAIHIDNNL